MKSQFCRIMSWAYDSLSQVALGKRCSQHGTPVAGQQFEYAFDDIGNGKTAGRGGDDECIPDSGIDPVTSYYSALSNTRWFNCQERPLWNQPERYPLPRTSGQERRNQAASTTSFVRRLGCSRSWSSFTVNHFQCMLALPIAVTSQTTAL